MIKNLFVINQGKIALFRLHDNRLEEIKKEGEIFFDLTDGFWGWWVGVVDYVSGDSLDLCFVWNKEQSIIFDNKFFKQIDKKTAWNKNIILQALNALGIKNAILKDKDTKIDNVAFKSNIFFTNLSFSNVVCNADNFIKVKAQKESKSQAYYRKLLEKEALERRKKS